MKDNNKQPIRILQVFSRMDKGGAETMIMTYYRKIDRTKVQFDFLVHTDDECAFDDEIEKLGGKIFRFPRYTAKNHFQYQRKWKQFLAGHPEYKIVHGHFFTISAVYFPIARKMNRICIAHSHISNVFTDSLIGRIKYSLFIKPIRNIANYYLACSADAGEWMYGKDLMNSDRFFVMNNAINAKNFRYDEERREEIRKQMNLEDQFVVGHIGRFTKQKNHEFLIDIFHEVKKREPNAILLLIGDGELKQRIIEKVKLLELQDSVIFTGVRSDISDLLQAMDVFLFPSKYEGLGIVLIEAQTSGLISYTSDAVVPKEAKVTDLLEFIPLSYNAKSWSDKVLMAAGGYARNDRYNDIVEKGYDVNTNITWFQEFYLGLV